MTLFFVVTIIGTLIAIPFVRRRAYKHVLSSCTYDAEKGAAKFSDGNILVKQREDWICARTGKSYWYCNVSMFDDMYYHVHAAENLEYRHGQEILAQQRLEMAAEKLNGSPPEQGTYR
jgi:hypothetical protein